ncbi:MAG: hypothetical protein ACTHMS_15575 [Jatrophihabitans sp.]|uniref:hypothetical protein n=1 Tax=Jatrophihabitans sp. TaxID=1932789 RepID=UPI003F80198C
MSGRLTGAALLALCAVAACTSGSHTAKATGRPGSRPVPAPASTAHLSTFAPSSAPTSPLPSDAATRAAQSALLTPGDLPAGFTAQPGTDADIPQPCLPASTTPVLQRYAPTTQVGQNLAHATPTALLSERIIVFPSPAVAQAAEQAAGTGLHCVTGHLPGAHGTAQAVDVQGPTDLLPVLGVPVSTLNGWTLQTNQLFESLLIARTRSELVVLTVVTPLGTDLAKLPDGRAVAQAALKKVLAARLD